MQITSPVKVDLLSQCFLLMVSTVKRHDYSSNVATRPPSLRDLCSVQYFLSFFQWWYNLAVVRVVVLPVGERVVVLPVGEGVVVQQVEMAVVVWVSFPRRRREKSPLLPATLVRDYVGELLSQPSAQVSLPAHSTWREIW